MRPGAAELNAKMTKKKRLYLDCGSGFNPQPGCITMDKRPEADPDVVHDLEDLPYPFPDDTFDRITLSHVMEHLNPKLTNDIMNEFWRISKMGGYLLLAMPYAGSFGYWQDPTHCNGWNECTATYFCPEKPLYQIYRPRPWRLEQNLWRSDGNIEIAFSKMTMEEAETILNGATNGNQG